LKSKISHSISISLAIVGAFASVILVLLAYLHATRIEALKRVENLSAFLQGPLRNPLWNIDPPAAHALAIVEN
jgi:hypothetical protein